MADEAPPFDAALREAHSRLMNVHLAALGTLEAELQRMRDENTALRLRLAEAGLSMMSACGASIDAAASCQKADGVSIPEGPQFHAASPLGEAAVSSASGAQESFLPESAIVGGLRMGAPVRLHGLRSSPKLNGLEGVCSHWDTAGGRWVIRLLGGEEKAIRPENLTLLADAAGLDASASPGTRTASMPATAGASLHAASGPASASVASSEEDVMEEILTEGAAAERSAYAAADESEALLQNALSDVLASLGVQDLDARCCGGNAWIIGGVPVLLHYDETQASAPASTRLLASTDGGREWDLFTNVYQRHAMQAQQEAPRSAAPAAQLRQQQQQQQQRAQPGMPRSGEARQQGARSPQNASSDSRGSRRWTDQRAPAEAGRGADMPIDHGMAEGESLPEFRSDGLPTFHGAFPSSFDARSGQNKYYSQFRVRVPTSSQYNP